MSIKGLNQVRLCYIYFAELEQDKFRVLTIAFSLKHTEFSSNCVFLSFFPVLKLLYIKTYITIQKQKHIISKHVLHGVQNVTRNFG